MSTKARLEEYAERLRARKKVALIYALFFLALLLVTSLGPPLLVALTDYRPDVVIVLMWFFLSMTNVVQISAKVAERRMLEQTLDLIKVLQETGAEDGSWK